MYLFDAKVYITFFFMLDVRLLVETIFFTHIKLHRYVKSNCISRSKEVSEERMCQVEFLERYAKRLREHREVDS